MNKTGKGGFKDHPELINHNGAKIRDFLQFRAAAIKIANEETQVGKSKMPKYESILRQWADSRNPLMQKMFIEAAFGKVPDSVDITSGGKVFEVVITHDDNSRQNLSGS